MQDNRAAQHLTGNVGADEYYSAGAILAFDFGEKRIGVAVGHLEMGLAHPLLTISSGSKDEYFSRIAQLIKEWQPVLLVVGLPTHPDGSEHELTRQSQRFARRLRSRFRMKAILVDERYTSTSASTALREAGVAGIKQKPVLDQVAAQLILQAYFDKRHANA